MNKKIIIGIIIILFLACCGVYSSLTSPEKGFGNVEVSTPNIDTKNLEITDNLVTSNSTTTEKKWYTTDKQDINTILVENNTTLTLKDSAVNKTGDSTSNGDNVDFYGTNSAILVKKGSTADISKTIINTNSTGSNAVFVTNAESDDTNMQSMSQPPADNAPGGVPNHGQGEQPEAPPEGMDSGGNPGMNDEDYSSGGATATIKNIEINTYQDKSRGLDATYGGVINAENVIINTRGGSCAAIATDRGEGNVNVTKSVLNTGVDNGIGRGSPCIYSTGNISVSDSSGTAYDSQIACIEGKNSITLINCQLNCFAGGNRKKMENLLILEDFSYIKV